MKFILLESRGGNYLVVAENIAWLRTGENGQTNVGMVGGSPLLVIGSIEEVAAKILAATAPEEPPAAAPAPQLAATLAPAVEPVAQAPAPEPVAQAPALKMIAAAPVPEPLISIPTSKVIAAAPDPEPVASKPALESAAPEPVRASPGQTPIKTPAPERPRPVARNSSPLWERKAPAAGTKIKAGTQRFMGALD